MVEPVSSGDTPPEIHPHSRCVPDRPLRTRGGGVNSTLVGFGNADIEIPLQIFGDQCGVQRIAVAENRWPRIYRSLSACLIVADHPRPVIFSGVSRIGGGDRTGERLLTAIAPLLCFPLLFFFGFLRGGVVVLVAIQWIEPANLAFALLQRRWRRLTVILTDAIFRFICRGLYYRRG